MLKKLWILLFSFSLNAESMIEPALPELSQMFNNIRDFTVYMNEAYFSAQSPLGDISVIVRIEKIKGRWTNPTIASFSGKTHDLEPFISNDGLKLLFASNRPKNDSSAKTKDYDIWVATRVNLNSSWSKPENMGSNINSDKNEFYPSLSLNNNLYFTANKKDSKGKDDIYFSQFKEGKYLASVSLGSAINSKGDEYNAFIAPDESYLIFGAYKREDSLGSGDLYISFKDDVNNWTQAKNMGSEVNSKYMDYCPFVDINSDTLYFTSKRSSLSDRESTNVIDLINLLNSSENGMSRIYQIPFIEKRNK